MPIPGLFIVGTDTDVGKTYVTALLIRELHRLGIRVGAYKPACSGRELTDRGEPFWPDVDLLVKALEGTGFDRNIDLKDRVCPQRFAAAAAPPVAARLEGRHVDRQTFDAGLKYWPTVSEFVLVEGIGGLLCPVTETETIADLAVAWKLPLLIVSRAGLGTINHTLLTIEGAQQRGLTVKGVLLNETEPATDDLSAPYNASEIARYTNVPIWGVLPHQADDWSCTRPHGEAIDLRHQLM